MKKAVLFKSNERFDAFQKKFDEYGIECNVLDFEDNEWVSFDFAKEKPSFVYKEDYNIDTPLEISLDLERIIVESLIKAVEKIK
ncbi:MAG: hypothetical protein K8S18_15860 [Desulfobacula sp.]|nr:hypothetical protein [Desulfobacula sp.]